MQTQTELINALGLQPWSAIEQNSLTLGRYPDRSGRTTKMLIDAIAAAYSRRVLILCSKSAVAIYIQQQLKDMVDRLIEAGAIVSFDVRVEIVSPDREQFVTRGWSGAIFRDHSYYEQP